MSSASPPAPVASAHDGIAGGQGTQPAPSHIVAQHGDKTSVAVHVDGTVDVIDNDALGGDLESMPDGYFTSPQFIGTVIAQCLTSICAYLGWVLPANTLALINADIGPSIHIGWAATIWTMSSSIGYLLVGRLSDLFGRKWMVLATTVLSLIGCIIGATAKNVAMLIVANGFNGFAAAGQLSFGIFLGELVPNKQRGPVVTLVFLSSLPFSTFGPVIARSLIEHTKAGWRWSFYMGIIFNVVTLVLYQFLYHPPTFEQLHVGKTRMQQLKELDWLGMFLFVAGWVLFLVGISYGGTSFPWKSAQVLCPLIVGIFVIVTFFVYEAYFCRVQPLMPPRMFKNVGYSAVVACATIGSMSYYSLTVLWPTIIQTIYTTDVIQIGWQSSVVGGGVLLGQIIGGFALSYVPKVKIQFIFAASLVLIFLTAMSTLHEDRHANTIAFGTIACVAVGYIENVAFPGVTLLWEPQDIGLATGVLGSIRGLGASIAQALYGSVYSNKLTTEIPKQVIPAALEAGLPRSEIVTLLKSIPLGRLASVPGMTDKIMAAVGQALVTANTHAFKLVFYATIPFASILFIASFFVPNFEKFLTHNVAKRLQDKVFRRNSVDEKRRREV